MKRAGKVWIRIFPDVPVSKKPTEVRMGKGKGTPEYWAAKVKPGRIMFEIDGVPSDIAHTALNLGSSKLPLQTKIITRPEGKEINNGKKEKEIRDMSRDQLIDHVEVLKKELFNLKIEIISGQNNNTSSISKIKKDIARAKTL